MIPYAPSTPYQRNATVADLMMQAGNQQAQAQLQKGAVWGRALGNIGDIASGAILDYQKQKAQAPIIAAKLADEQSQRQARDLGTQKTQMEIDQMQRDQAQGEMLKSLYADPANPPTLNKIASIVGPERAAAIIKLHGVADPTKQYKDVSELLRDGLLGVAALPESARPEGYKITVDGIRSRGIPVDQIAPPEYDANSFARLLNYGKAPEAPPTLQHIETDKGIQPWNPKTNELLPPIAQPKPKQVDPVAAELAQIRLGEARTKAADEKTQSEAFGKVPVERRTAIDRVTNSMPKERAASWRKTLSGLAVDGNEEDLRSAMKQAAIESEPSTSRTQLQGREQMVGSLLDAKAILSDMKTRGVPTDILTGSVEDIARKLGTSTNPEYVRLGNRLASTLIAYRKAATGAQFSEKESSQYQKMFPNYSNEFPVNDALIQGLLDEAQTNNRIFWSNKVGSKAAGWILGESAAAGNGPATTQPPPKPAQDGGWTVVNGFKIRVKK